jgi:hypothetical protein
VSLVLLVAGSSLLSAQQTGLLLGYGEMISAGSYQYKTARHGSMVVR